jgi:hypothetical protein
MKASKTIFLLLAILLFCFQSTQTYGFTITFKNTSPHKQIYLLYWVDHNFPDWYGPINLAGGELKAGNDHSVLHGYSAGLYYVQWRDFETGIIGIYVFETTETMHIITTPDGIEIVLTI